MNEFAHLIDHTNLKPNATRSEIIQLCEESIEYGFSAACVNPANVPLARSVLNENKPKLCTVIGFPLGSISVEMKFAEARFLIHQGAEELDMVLNIGALKEGETNIVEREIQQVVNAADGNCVKVIIETCLLNEKEMLRACKIILNAGAAYVKTSTGFSTEGARVEDIKLIKKNVGEDLGIKASGGIKTLEEVELMISAGANRIGTSKSVIIVS